MIDDERSLLIRHHPFSYGLLSLVFGLPVLYGLLLSWPDVSSLPAQFPGHWRTLVLFSALISSGLAIRTITPATELTEYPDRLEE